MILTHEAKMRMDLTSARVDENNEVDWRDSTLQPMMKISMECVRTKYCYNDQYIGVRECKCLYRGWMMLYDNVCGGRNEEAMREIRRGHRYKAVQTKQVNRINQRWCVNGAGDKEMAQIAEFIQDEGHWQLHLHRRPAVLRPSSLWVRLSALSV